jgi:endonuclease YncB( thermonuclease family)
MAYVGIISVNEQMIWKGLAWQLQAKTKAKKLNIWSAKSPVNPYDYRKNRQKKMREKDVSSAIPGEKSKKLSP